MPASAGHTLGSGNAWQLQRMGYCSVFVRYRAVLMDLHKPQEVAIGVQNTKLCALVHPISSPVPLLLKFEE